MRCDTKILKFPVEIRTFLHMPKGAKVLSAGVQGETIMVWALCDTTAPLVRRYIAAYGTGWDIPSDVVSHEFVATVFVGPLVFHVLDGGEAKQSTPEE